MFRLFVYSLHQAVYKNKMKIFTVGLFEVSKPYRYGYVKTHNTIVVGRQP